MNLAELIAATRGDRTQKDLARDAGLSIQTMQQYIAGGYPETNFPDTKNLRGLARCCRVDVRTVIRSLEETLAEVLGLDATDGGSKLVALLPPEAAYLTDEAIAAIRTLIIQAGRPAMEAAEVEAAAPVKRAVKAVKTVKAAKTATPPRPRR